MKFAEKLKKAMQELNLNQRQVVTMTGKSKGSVSQYLSGKQIPSEDVQSAIATSLGLASDYFTGMDQELQVMPQLEIRDGVIPRLDVTKAAKLMGMNHNTVRKGLQQGVFPWGCCILLAVLVLVKKCRPVNLEVVVMKNCLQRFQKKRMKSIIKLMIWLD